MPYVPRLPPGEKRVLRLVPAVATGALAFVVITALPVALGFVSYGLGLGTLAALTFTGLLLSYRAGILSTFIAIFVALLPAALAVGGADDLKTARRTVVAEVGVSEAPTHGDVQVLLLRDARVAAEFAARWTSRPTSGGAEQHHAAAPLVPPDWQRTTPVPAWRVCSGGAAGWCEHALAQPVRAARRLTATEAARYRDGIADAERRFGLVSAPAAPLLQLTTPPADRARAAVTGMVFVPLAGFVAWLLGLLIWRGIGGMRRAAAT